jgi:hypothetical protein
MNVRIPRPPAPAGRRQRGAVLIVGLIMLGVMTLFVISMLKASIIELKIGGSSQVAALNFANAETGVNNFIQVNSGRFAPNFLTLPVGSGGPLTTAAPLQAGGSVAVTVTQLACGAWATFGNQMGGSSLQAVQFDVRGTAVNTTLGGSTTVHQGVQTLAAAGSC